MICVQLVNYGQPGPSAPGQDLFTAYGSSSVLYLRNQANGCTNDQYVLQSGQELLDPSTLGITPQSVTYVFSWGLAAVLLMFVLGVSVGAGIGLIRKL